LFFPPNFVWGSNFNIFFLDEKSSSHTHTYTHLYTYIHTYIHTSIYIYNRWLNCYVLIYALKYILDDDACASHPNRCLWNTHNIYIHLFIQILIIHKWIRFLSNNHLNILKIEACDNGTYPYTYIFPIRPYTHTHIYIHT